MNFFSQARVVWSKFRTWGMAGVWGVIRRNQAIAAQRRRIAALIRQPTQCRPVPGITLVVDFTSKMALSKTMRDFASKLKSAGIPFQVFDLRECPQIPEGDYAGLLTPPEEFDFHRYTHVVELYRSVVGRIPERKARIVFHDSEAGILEAMPFLDTEDDIIALSDFNYRYFQRALTRSRRVHKIVYPFLPVATECQSVGDVRRELGLSADDFVVFYNFDIGNFHRKNPLAALRAFAKAFPDVPRAKLLFKVKGAEEHRDEMQRIFDLAEELGIGDRLVTVVRYLPRVVMDGLTGAADVYLSLHKSEGFGIGMAEAMAQGCPVVATDWSGNTEFCRSENSMPVRCRMVPIQPWEYPSCMKEWAEADIDDAAVKLRRLYDDPALRKELGSRARAFIKEHYSVAMFKRSVEEFLNG